MVTLRSAASSESKDSRQMKTIILFHRLDLADLFAPVARELGAKVRVVHLAYSQNEVQRLRELGVAGPITIFTDEVRRLYPSSTNDAKSLAQIDALFIRQSGGAFNLNGAIQSDRAFSLLSLEEAQRLTETYWRFWKAFLDTHEADAVLHEPCSLMFNFVAAMLCADRGAHYLYPIMAYGPDKGLYHLLMSGFDFTCPDLERVLRAGANGDLQVDEEFCTAFLAEFRKSFTVFLAGVIKQPSLPRVAASTIKTALMHRRKNPYDRVLDNIDHWQTKKRVAAAKLRNLIRYRREIRFESPIPGERFYFYPLHLEPEAVVLYHAHGIYSNQVKLVQNIAAQLPPGVMLYVKDHPHNHGYRSANDYLALTSIPNIRLLESRFSGKQITAGALGVITLVGTAGFEALLLGKQVFTFGKTFYSAAPGVVQLRHIRDLREALYLAADRPSVPDTSLYPYLTAYFAALHPGLTDYFDGRAQHYGVDLGDNAKVVAQGLLATLEGCE